MSSPVKLHVAHTSTTYQPPLLPPMQEMLDRPWWVRWFLPIKESRLMADEAAKSGGLWMPYPLLGILLSLVLVLGGGIIGLYSTVTTMNATMLMRDADYRQQMTEQKNKLELLQMYVNDDRKALAVLQHEADKQQKRNQ